jgi:hypothetical protein
VCGSAAWADWGRRPRLRLRSPVVAGELRGSVRNVYSSSSGAISCWLGELLTVDLGPPWNCWVPWAELGAPPALVRTPPSDSRPFLLRFRIVRWVGEGQVAATTGRRRDAVAAVLTRSPNVGGRRVSGRGSLDGRLGLIGAGVLGWNAMARPIAIGRPLMRSRLFKSEPFARDPMAWIRRYPFGRKIYRRALQLLDK